MAAMLWWFPRWLADKSLPLLGAVLVQKKKKRELHCKRWKQESHPYYDLQVKVLKARNIQNADPVTKADCYVQLRLPTASPSPMQTRTVDNCNDPEWNETFHYQLHSAVKNVLDLTLCDSDVLLDDSLMQKQFSLDTLKPGQPFSHTFQIKDQDPGELQVEFILEESHLPASEVITNGVLVKALTCKAQACSFSSAPPQAQPCIRVQGTLEQDSLDSGQPWGYDLQPVAFSPHCKSPWSSSRNFQVAISGASEKPQLLTLQPAVEGGPPATFCFHVNPVVSRRLEVALEEKLQVLQSDLSGEREIQTSKLDEGHLLLASVPLGQEQQQTVALGEGQEVTLRVSAEMRSGELDLRLGFDLCDRERQFLNKRKPVVSKALQRVLGLRKAPDSDQVPVVAVLGSGGGVRAMSALYGSLAGLQELGILDTVTYLSGVSGSTWCMSTLFKDPAWSQKSLQGPIERAQTGVCSSKMGAFSVEQLQYYVSECLNHRLCLIDIWGLFIKHFLHQEESPAKLSDQQEAINQGQNPYPIYASINVHNNISGEDFAEWCEFTPYEVGFPKYGAYIPTQLFGSEFFMGRLLRQQLEPQIYSLEGIWSSAFAGSLQDLLLKLSDFNLNKQQGENVDVIENYKVPDIEFHIPQGPISQALQNLFQSRPIAFKGHNFLRGLGLHKSYADRREFVAWKKNHLDSNANKLTPMWNHLSLVDAGLAINSPFPLILCPRRDVDLILSFSYSRSKPFEDLQMTEKYCKDRGIPFPRIKVHPKDLEEPQECYLFADCEDPCSPIVLHFPLVNRTFRTHLSPGVERQTAKERDFAEFSFNGPDSSYSTIKLTYSPLEFKRLVQLTRYNVLNQAEQVRQALELALHRRQGWGADLDCWWEANLWAYE